MSDSSNDSGDLSLSCSVSSIESEESEVSQVEGDQKQSNHISMSPYLVIHQQPESDTEAEDDDSGDEERLCSRDWQEFACMTIKDNPGVF